MCSIGAVGGTNQHLKLFLTLDLQFYRSASCERCVAGFDVQLGWSFDRWAGWQISSKEVRHAADLLAGSCRNFSAVFCNDARE